MTRKPVVGALIGCVLAGLAGCGKPSAAPGGAQAGQAGVSVTVVRPEQKALRREIEQPARVEAFEETPLVSRLSGYVNRLHVDIGDRVRGPRFDADGKLTEPGQVLAELAVPELEEEVRQKQALVAQAQAEVEQAVAALETAEANVLTAGALIREAEAARAKVRANVDRWESEYKRIEDLVQRKVIDTQTRDETRNQFKAAEAACHEVEAKVHSALAMAKESAARRNKARADIAAAKARVQVAQAEEGRLRALLDYSKLRAPFDGIVIRRNIHTGHFLQPAGGAGAQPLFVVARTDTLRVLVDVPEAEAMFISDGVVAQVRCQIVKDRDFKGKVSRSSWSLDLRTRTLRTEIDLPNPDGKLRPGMYAYVTFMAELPTTFTVPTSALTTQGGEPCVYCVENGKAVCTSVRLGARVGTLVQVLKKRKGSGSGPWEDFTGKEEIVLTSSSALADGQPVTLAGKS